MKNNTKQKLAEAFVPLMVRKITQIEKDFKQPWISADLGIPRNIRGTRYNGFNFFFLLLMMEEMKYQHPVFLTFNQAKQLQLSVRKGEKAFPIYHYAKYVFHKETKERIKYEDYKKLSETEKTAYKVIPKLTSFNVFNVEQTDIREKDPEKWESFGQVPVVVPGEKYDCNAIDEMIARQSWFCPISLEPAEYPYYQLLEDRIVCPLKSQFKDHWIYR